MKYIISMLFTMALVGCATGSQDIKSCLKACAEGKVTIYRDDNILCQCNVINLQVKK